jgi:hypothetical protein
MGSLKLCPLGWPKAGLTTSFQRRTGKKMTERSKSLQKLPGKGDGTKTCNACAKQHRQQFCIRQCRCTLRKQAFAGSLTQGPLDNRVARIWSHDVFLE